MLFRSDLGLVHRCFPHADLEAETRSLAAQIATMAPRALRYARLAVRRRLPSALSAEETSQLVADCFGSEDYQEGMAAFLEKRSPVFRGR